MQQNNGLDKNQLISFFIFSAILFGVMLYFQNKQLKEEAAQQNKKVKTEQPTKKINPTPAANINTAVKATSIQKVNLKNNEISIDFSSLGGQITKVNLLKYKAYNHDTDKADLPLYLIDKNSSSYGFQFKDRTGKIINTKDLVFSPSVKGNTVTFTSNLNGALIQFIYTLNPKYALDFNVKTQGLIKAIKSGCRS